MMTNIQANLPITKVQELPTERLILRPWRAQDFSPFAALNADPEVMRYFPATLSRAESDAMTLRCQSLIEERGWGFWAAEETSTGAFIGMIGLHTPEANLPCSPCVEVGWRLAKAHWGQGYATEGAAAALRFAFLVLGLKEVVSFTALPNTPSQAVMRRLGMRRDEATFQHPALPKGHRLAEHCLYRVSAAPELSSVKQSDHS